MRISRAKYLRKRHSWGGKVLTVRWVLPRLVVALALGKLLVMTLRGTASTADEQQVRELVQLSKQHYSPEIPLEQITMLDLSNLGLNRLPDNFGTLLPNLSILFLTNNKFQELPAVIGEMPKLQMVSFKGNGMESIHPDALQPQLRWLILTGNKLRELPGLERACTNLQKLMLSGNQLTALPASSIRNCHKLELVRLASNRLEQAPIDLLRLGNLRWVALSDNPFMPKLLETPVIPVIADTDLDVSHSVVLGSGAGGNTKKAIYKSRPVAVKVYRGALTSDGLPAMERNIAILASSRLLLRNSSSSSSDNKAVVKVLGQTTDGSLVMEFLDHFHAVAQPPSFETCSRDVYEDADKRRIKPHALHLVSAVLDVLTDLHEIGVMHGDLYGHNILIHDGDGQVRLSDFGAGFYYGGSRKDDLGEEWLSLLQQIEMRSFATFVEEIAELLADGEKQLLLQLGDMCLQGTRFETVNAWWKKQQRVS